MYLLWRAVCIINNVDVSKYNFGPRQRGRGLVGVTDVGVVYTPSTMSRGPTRVDFTYEILEST